MKSVIVFFCCLLGFVSYGYAAIYQNIGPLDKLGDLKAKFPKANFTRAYPAWLQKNEVLYQISGEGMSGKIIVLLYDLRIMYQEILDKNPEDRDAEFYKKAIKNTDDASISVNWVRWIPDYPIPVTRLVAKYGKPDQSGFADENLQPYRRWETKGLIAFLTDDEKGIVRIDYIFTKSELRAAVLQKSKMPLNWQKGAPAVKNGSQ